MQFAMISRRIPFFGPNKNQQDLFWDLAKNHMRFLYNVAFKYTGNRNDAEDLVQETLYAAYRKFHQLQDNRKFKSWVVRILRNNFLKARRKQVDARTGEFEDGIDYMSELEANAWQQDAAALYESKAEAATIRSIIDGLPEKYKAVLVLYYMEDSSYQEIAELLEVPIGTVMSRLSRAKQMAKKTLLRSQIKAPRAAKVIRLDQKR